MKRYTEKHYDENGYYLICSGNCETLNCGDCGILDKIVDRLAAIEDILGDEYELDRLRELVMADREGRCVVLPCKIGDFVYLIKRKLDGSDCVQKAEFWWSDIPEIGKTVFLTREEAEDALEGMKNG